MKGKGDSAMGFVGIAWIVLQVQDLDRAIDYNTPLR